MKNYADRGGCYLPNPKNFWKFWMGGGGGGGIFLYKNGNSRGVCVCRGSLPP